MNWVKFWLNGVVMVVGKFGDQEKFKGKQPEQGKTDSVC